jgi:hemoglobin/transferrin/lactoferrin receptor protein
MSVINRGQLVPPVYNFNYSTKATFVLLVIFAVAILTTQEVKAQTANVSAETTNVERVNLDGATLVAEPIVIDAGIEKQKQGLVAAPGNQVKIGKNKIQSTPGGSLKNALSGEANINFEGGPRGAAQMPQLRGLPADKVLILDEGVRQNFQGEHGGRMFGDFTMMESVEVVKGPWSSMYGSGAMGGVVSFKRSTAADYLRRQNVTSAKHIGGEIVVDGGTAASELGQRFTLFGKRSRYESLFSYRRADAGNTELANGQTLDYSSSYSQDFYTSQAYEFSKKQAVLVKVNRLDERAETPLNPAEDISSINPTGDLRRIKQDVVTDYVYRGAKSETHVKPYVRQTVVEKVQDSNGRRVEQVVNTAGFDGWTSIDQKISENWVANHTVGAEFFQDKNIGERSSTSSVLFPTGRTRQAGVYAQSTVVANSKWMISPGVRYDRFENQDEGIGRADNKGDETSGKLYTSYEFKKDQKVFAGIGQAFNAPRIQDLYRSDRHFPGNFFVPNPELKPETSETVELGTTNLYRLNEDNAVTFNVTVFQTRSEDFISRKVNFAAGTTEFENLDRVYSEGAEVAVGWQSPKVGTQLALGKVRAIDRKTGTPVNAIPADQATLTVTGFLSDKWSVGTEIKAVDNQDKVKDDPRTPGYVVQDLFAAYKFKQWQANARVGNVTDHDYREHGSAITSVGQDFKLSVGMLF